MRMFLPLLCVVLSVVAQDPIETAAPQRQVRLDLLVVRLPAKRAVSLQADLRDPSRAKRGQQALLELVEKDQAELIDWPILRTLSNNRAVAENISEIRYPVEFAPPRIIQNPVSAERAVTLDPKAPERSEIDGETANGKVAKASPGLLAGIPATFETRNAGVSFEAEPMILDGGKTISIHLAPQHVAFTGFRRTTVEAPGQYRVAVDGEPHLLSFKKLTEPKDTVEIFLLTATIEEIDVEEASAPELPKSPGKDGQ